MSARAITLLAQILASLRLGLLWCSVAGVAATHYTCTSDEVSGELQGETGVVCSPRCTEGTFDCPSDVPDGTTAQPQCMLMDVDKVGYCGLLCEVDNQCPSGGICWRAAALEAGLCVKPLSFTEWSRLAGARKKLDLGWPPGKAGQTSDSRGYRLTKAYQSLMSLKSRFSIADGDSDVLVVEEMISVARAVSAASASSSNAAQVPSQPQPQQQSLGLPAPALGAQSDSVLGPWKQDLAYFAGNVQQGLPGMQREIHDTIWNVEHLQNQGVASELLRSVILIAIAYLGIGSAYKYQTMGARGMDMIPHIGFWVEYPRLVVDGVAYAQMKILELLGQSSQYVATGGLSSRKSCSERDSFGNFEPSL